MLTELVANIGIGSEVVRNDFDHLPIYREIREETDQYGNVFIRIPKFYIKKESGAEYRIQISKEKLEGYYLPHVFYDFEKDLELDYFLYGAYEGSLSADGERLESKEGTKPLVSRNIVQFRDLARANGRGYQQNDIHAIDVLQALFYVEFGTLHSQSIHPGFTSGNTEPATSGFSKNIASTSGAMGTGGSYPFMYRGIENPWGSVYEFIDGINILDNQTWIAKNAEDYTSNVYAVPYEKLGYINCTENGIVTQMGFDPKYPYAEFPVAVGGSSTTYYADYYYQSFGQRIALFGGDWANGSSAGLSLWHLNNSSGTANSKIGGRLLKKPLA